VTHNINIARTAPANVGMLLRKHLVMFGPKTDRLSLIALRGQLNPTADRLAAV
jgi:hypothetical protein